MSQWTTLGCLFVSVSAFLGCSCSDDTATGGSGGAATGAGGSGGGGEGPINNTGAGGMGTGGAGGASCVAPLADCNGDPGDGCEVDTDTDPQHCGDCATPCDVGSCAGGICQVPEVLLDGIATPTHIGTDGVTLFFNSAGHANQLYFDGYVGAIPVAGAPNPTVLVSPVVSPEALTLDGDNVLYSSVGTQGGDGLDGFLASVPKMGGGSTTFAASQSWVLHIVLEGADRYWTSSGTFSQGFSNGKVLSQTGMDLPIELTTDQIYPDGTAVDASYVYWTTTGTAAASYLDGSVRRVPRAGGPEEILVEDLNFATGLAYADGHLYFGTKNAVNVIDLATPNAYTEFEPTPKKPSLLLVDGGDLFWTESSMAGRVMRKPLSGAPATVMAAGILHPYGLAADATHLYFAQRGTGIDDGALYRIAR